MIKMPLGDEPIRMKVDPAVVVYPGGGGGNVSSADISTIVVLDRAEYDALAVKDTKTVYLIRG